MTQSARFGNSNAADALAIYSSTKRKELTYSSLSWRRTLKPAGPSPAPSDGSLARLQLLQAPLPQDLEAL
jgi:hypothetical protein